MSLTLCQRNFEVVAQKRDDVTLFRIMVEYFQSFKQSGSLHKVCPCS